LERRDHNGLVYYQFDQWLDSKTIAHGVMTRLGGVSQGPFDSLNVGGTVGDDNAAVQINIQRSYEALDLDGTAACTVWQIHSADVIIAETRSPGRRWLTRADGIVTDRPNVPLSMRFADCLPILLYDPAHHAIGLAHAGWRGTVSGVVKNTLNTMQVAYGTQPADVEAAIGPGIGPDKFQVGPEVVNAVESTFGAIDDLVRYADDGSAYLNLWEANALALTRAGVHKIEIARMCTASRTDEFYSHRAEKGKTGRFGAIIALKEIA
jgi:YfiH family protein